MDTMISPHLKATQCFILLPRIACWECFKNWIEFNWKSSLFLLNGLKAGGLNERTFSLKNNTLFSYIYSASSLLKWPILLFLNMVILFTIISFALSPFKGQILKNLKINFNFQNRFVPVDLPPPGVKANKALLRHRC